MQFWKVQAFSYQILYRVNFIGFIFCFISLVWVAATVQQIVNLCLSYQQDCQEGHKMTNYHVGWSNNSYGKAPISKTCKCLIVVCLCVGEASGSGACCINADVSLLSSRFLWLMRNSQTSTANRFHQTRFTTLVLCLCTSTSPLTRPF